MVHQFHSENSSEDPRSKISQFTQDFLDPLKLHRVELFPSTIYVFSHTNSLITEEINSLPNDPEILSHLSPGAKRSIVEGSHNGMYGLQLFKRYNMPEFERFITTALERVYPEAQIFQSWINKLPKGSSQAVHTHANSVVSGVYYHETLPQMGGIVFMNPNPYSKMAMWGTEEGRFFPCTPNTLVLFPSWMEHKTSENRSDLPRVSLAFNAK